MKNSPVFSRKCKIEYPNLEYGHHLHGGSRASGVCDWNLRLVQPQLPNVVNTMDAFYCAETLKTAMEAYGKFEIFNSDQGSQFTSSEFVAELRAHDIPISMDGRGRLLG